jgi:N-acyl homoserine lactone hydrolase
MHVFKVLSLALVTFSCVASHHPVVPSERGTASSESAFLASLQSPGPVTVETVTAATWEVDRKGLINLEHPVAKAAKLEDGPERIELYVHVLRHPKFGLFFIDSGVEKALRDSPEMAAVRGLVATLAKTDKLSVLNATSDVLKAQTGPLQGVFLTHLHLDHILGLPDVPKTATVYVGRGELQAKSMTNAVTAGVVDESLKGLGPVNEWPFQPTDGGVFQGMVDIFGDGSVWALSVPGHTPGSTAYLANTPDGAVLFVGDASHTAWGWNHDVEPGAFSSDLELSAKSFQRLREFSKAHPNIAVRLGHQSLTP